MGIHNVKDHYAFFQIMEKLFVTCPRYFCLCVSDAYPAYNDAESHEAQRPDSSGRYMIDKEHGFKAIEEKCEYATAVNGTKHGINYVTPALVSLQNEK